MSISASVHCRRLTNRGARHVARVESRVLTRTRRRGRRYWQGLLDRLELEERNLSFGMFAGQRPVGYVILEIRDEKNDSPHTVQLVDLALLPQFRRHLRSLLVNVRQQCDAYAGGATLVVAARDAATLDRWAAARNLQRYLGCVARQDGSRLVFDLRAQAPALHSPLPPPEPVWTARIGSREITVRSIEDARQWLSLADDWQRLLDETPETTVFQTFGYQRCWWRYFGMEYRLLILVIEEHGRVVGIAPLLVSSARVYGMRMRFLGFVGAPWEVDRAAFLFGANRSLCTAAVARYLHDHRSEWDVFEMFEQAPAQPDDESLIKDLQRSGALFGSTHTSQCPYLKLEGSWEKFRAGLPRKLRKNLGRSKRILEADGPVRMDCIETWPDLDDALISYREIERRSWKPVRQLGIGRSHSQYGFYRALAQSSGSDMRFVMRLLRVGERAVSGTFGLEYRGVFYSIMIAHDAAYGRASPGTLLEALELEDCFERKLSEYDFLGGFLSNKLRWTKTVRDTRNLHFYRRRPGPMFIWVLHFCIKPLCRTALQKLRLLDRSIALKKRVANVYANKIRRRRIHEVRRADLLLKD